MKAHLGHHRVPAHPQSAQCCLGATPFSQTGTCTKHENQLSENKDQHAQLHSEFELKLHWTCLKMLTICYLPSSSMTKSHQSPCFGQHGGSSGNDSNTFTHMPQHRITIDTQAHHYKVLKQLKNNILISSFLCRFQCFVLGVGMKKGVLSS